MWNFWRDVRLACRTALRSPGYSTITIVTLGLAIGANTLLFSIAGPLIIRGFPIHDPGRVGWVSMSNQPQGITDRGRSSLPDFLDWRASARSFTDLAAYALREGTMTGAGDAERILTARATANLPTVWGVQPARGRLFQPGEDAPGRAKVGVLSSRFWRERFNAEETAVGQTLFVDGEPVTIVGVMAPEIELGTFSLIDIWTPLPLDASAPRDERTLRVMGRLASGATVQSASAEIAGLAAALARDHVNTNKDWAASVVSTQEAMASSDTYVILALMGVVVVFVLLIACVNLANLVLARTVARRHEFAVQAALGASRLQLIRPLLLESFVLSLTGGGLGLGVAAAGLRGIKAMAYEPFFKVLSIDGPVLIFTAIVAVLTPALFSLWPAISAGRAGAADAIRENRGTAGRKASRRRAVLVVSEIALALSLLVMSGLIVQSMLHLQRVQLGVDVPHLVTFRFDLPKDRYPDDGSRSAFARDVSAALAALPRSSGAAVLSHLPVFDGEVVRTLTGTPHDSGQDGERAWASWYAVTPGYFETAGVRLAAGRRFDDRDRSGAQPVALLSRLAAERYFGDAASAVDRTVTVTGRGAPDRVVAIVGVAEDTRDSQVTRTSPQIYVPFDQWPSAAMSVLLRADDPKGVVADVRPVMRALDPNVAVANLRTLEQVVNEDLASARIINSLFIGFALLALALAAAGLYGVISYSISQRRREIGVRLALGAAPAAIWRMVLAEGLRVTAIGVVVGLLLAVGLAQAARSILFGVGAGDLATFGGVTLGVLLVAVAAMLNPAARAMRVDPVRTLRAD